jgi:hypothetical protein
MTTSTLVPAVLPCAINGRPYLCEPTYKRETLPVIRQQADTGEAPGEHSLNPQGLWRRSRETFHHGAGQVFCDAKDSDEARFRASKGIDPWTRGELSLLNKTVKVWSSANTNLALLALNGSLGTYLYIADGNELYWNEQPFNLLSWDASSFEVSTGGWLAGTNTILTRSTTQSYVGSASLRAERTTSTGTISANTPTGVSGIAVDASRTYRFGAACRWVGGTGAGRIPTVFVDWYTAAGASISTDSVVGLVADSSTGWLLLNSSVTTSPATAAFASMRVEWPGAVVGEAHYADVVYLQPNIGPFGGGSVFQTADIQAGEAAQPIASVTTNGYHIWAALGTSGIHRTNVSATGSTANVPAGTFNLVGYAAPYLLAANGNILYEITDPLGTPAASILKTHANAEFDWTVIASGRNCLYVAGNSGANAELYRIGIDQTTGGLGALTPCAPFPEGETIHAIYYYAGAAILGTGKGVRIATADGAGNLDYGPLIETTWPVRALEPQGRYCWFGWRDYDATTTGLGRIDLGYFTESLVPAWASDLMTPATTQGDILSAVTYIPYNYQATQSPVTRAFAVSGVGVYIEDTGYKVPSGTLETGAIRFATTETKTARAVEIRHHALAGTVAVDMKRDDGAYASVGTSSVAGSNGTSLDAGSLSAETFELRFTSTRSSTVPATGPELVRWTEKVLPTPRSDEVFTLTLLLNSSVLSTAGDGQPYPLDVPAEVAAIKALEWARTVVDFQVGSDTFVGYVGASEFTGTHWEGPRRRFSEGKMVVQMVTVAG